MRTPYVLKLFLQDLAGQILLSVEELDYRFGQMHCSGGLFGITQLNFWAKVPGYKMVMRCNDKNDVQSVPLMILSAVNKPRPPKMPRHEIPGALAATIAYSRNQQLTLYDGFAIFVDESQVFVSRLRASQSYMRNLVEYRTVAEPLPLYRSVPFDMFKREGRRELVRLLIGVSRYLDASEQSKIGNTASGEERI